METETKTQYILRACSDHNVQELRKLATSQGGFLEDELRRKAWPLLLGSDEHPLKTDVDWTTLAKHRDEYQVQLDVDRSFIHYPSGDSNERKNARKDELSQIITAVLRQHRMLHYFQGYHDIVQVLLLVLGAEAAHSAVARLSLLRIRDFMLPTMSETESHLRLLPYILSIADRKLCEHLSQTRPFFALAATLTLYAHEIEDYGQIARLFDFLLASEAVVPIYLFVAIVLARKDELLEIDANEPEMLGSVLTRLPRPLDLEALIRTATSLFENHPPQSIGNRAWRHISKNSVLNTTHGWRQLETQTLEDGERWFDLQAKEAERADAWRKQRLELVRFAKRYKQTARYTGLAVLVAIIALAFRDPRFSAVTHGISPILRSTSAVSRKLVDLMQGLVL